jgi:hypothetical protein
MLREDLIFSAVLFMSILLLLGEMHAFIRRWRGRGGPRPV